MKNPKIVNEFKEFAMRGNVLDMAVGVIIGGAFGKIISSLVENIITPVLGLVIGKINISDLSFTVALFDESEPISVNYGLFLQNVLDFFIVALCIFFIVKAANIFKKKQVEEPAPTPSEPEPTKEEILLTEIRDILKEGRSL